MVGTIRFTNQEEKLNHLRSLQNIPSINPKSYDPNGEFHRLDYIVHDEFGVGFVEEVITSTQIRVFFVGGEKLLTQKSFLRQAIVV